MAREWEGGKARVTHLHLNVQQHNPPLGRLLLDSLLAGPIPVTAELGVLDEAVVVDEVLKVLHLDEVVVHAVGLAGAGRARRVRDGEGEGVGVAREEEVVEGPLADARGPGEDEGAGVFGGWGAVSCDRMGEVGRVGGGPGWGTGRLLRG